jgi:thioesterase III
METKIHHYPIKILEGHLDTYGHVNNAVYLKIFEEARWEMITANGYGWQKIQDTGIGPTILEVNVKFRKELRLRQEVVIETRVLSAQRRLAIIHQEIKDTEGTLYSVAEFKFALFDIHARKLVLPTPDWLKALGLRG